MSTILNLAIIISNVIFSYKGFNDAAFFDDNKFETGKVLRFKQYKRLITSGFLHSNWSHLLFNMLALWFFGSSLEAGTNSFFYIFIYLVSLLCGNLFALYIYRYSDDYSAIGASGAVCGVIFACIALFPGMDINLFLIPIPIPAWLFGLGYTLYTIYGIRSRTDNIGHEAHLGGALAGMLIALLFYPESLLVNYIPILLVLVPASVFIYIIIKHPAYLFVDNYFFRKNQFHNVDEKYNHEKVAKQQEIDRILEKINKRGIQSLSKKEKDTLDKYSAKL